MSALANLQKANTIRIERAKIKRKIGSMDREEAARAILALIAGPGVTWRRASVGSVLQMAHGVGEAAARRILRYADQALQPERQVGDLTVRQVKAIKTAVERWARCTR